MFETIIFGILIFVLGALIVGTFAFAERNRRRDRQEFLTVMEKISGNTERIAEHTRHIAELVVQNGNALGRVEVLTQQILTRLADNSTTH
jgi:hypothetical protein